MRKIMLMVSFVFGLVLFANLEANGQGVIYNNNLKLYENYNTYGIVQTKNGQTYLCVAGSISRTSGGNSAKNYNCSNFLTDNSKLDFGAMYIAVVNAENNYNSLKALERIEAKVNENTEATRKMQASIEQQNKEFNVQLQKSVAKSFDGLPLTILKQIKENPEFRNEILKILLDDADFKKQIEALIKENIGNAGMISPE